MIKTNLLVFSMVIFLFACGGDGQNDNTNQITKLPSTPLPSEPASKAMPSSPASTATPLISYEDELSEISYISDPKNISWPRVLEINNKYIYIEEKPNRVATISLGHDEILFGITDKSQIIATTSFAQDPNSNIYSKAQGLPVINSDPENVIALNPDIVFADPYASVDLIDALEDFGIIVIQTQLSNSIEGRYNDLWLMAYATGNLDNAEILAKDIENKINVLNSVSNEGKNSSKTVLALSWWDAYWTAGTGSTEDSVITLGGGLNAAAEARIQSNTTIDKEQLISINPDVIVITQSPEWGGEDFYEQLMSDTSLGSISAINNSEVFLVNSNWWTTLSYWNIKGSQELAKIIYGKDGFEEFGDF
ncbi:MAG: ABC transporter substrate-binding protein [Dehalococcoidia bacterium]